MATDGPSSRDVGNGVRLLRQNHQGPRRGSKFRGARSARAPPARVSPTPIACPSVAGCENGGFAALQGADLVQGQVLPRTRPRVRTAFEAHDLDPLGSTASMRRRTCSSPRSSSTASAAFEDWLPGERRASRLPRTSGSAGAARRGGARHRVLRGARSSTTPSSSGGPAEYVAERLRPRLLPRHGLQDAGASRRLPLPAPCFLNSAHGGLRPCAGRARSEPPWHDAGGPSRTRRAGRARPSPRTRVSSSATLSGAIAVRPRSWSWTWSRTAVGPWAAWHSAASAGERPCFDPAGSGPPSERDASRKPDAMRIALNARLLLARGAPWGGAVPALARQRAGAGAGHEVVHYSSAWGTRGKVGPRAASRRSG